MTAAKEHFMLALDGVSGVQPPMRPEDFSWNLRMTLSRNLATRFAAGTDISAYDAKLKQYYGLRPGEVPNTPIGASWPAEWLKELLSMSWPHGGTT
jgi:hypothetical protein